MHACTAPQVSIVIPAYNTRNYIGETLESAINQSFRSFEIIVVDDGSTDDTHAIVEMFCDRRVTLLRQANSGIGAARNHAISVARGEYIALLDSDDLWEPDFLNIMVEFLRQNRDVSIAFCNTRFFGVSKFAGRTFQEVYPPSPPITFAKLAGEISHVAVAAILRREVFTRVGLFDTHESIRGVEDFDLWLRALHSGFRIAPVPNVLAHYRRHAASLSGSESLEKSALYTLSKWRSHASLTADERDAVEKTYSKMGAYVDVREAIRDIHNGDYHQAGLSLLRACEYNPKWRYRAARLGLAIWPGLTRLALRRVN